MLIKCPSCGWVRKHGDWIKPNDELGKILKEVKIIESECHNCKGMKADVPKT